MSLTNPKTVVTEERLSEFYQGILPYLGGMPEILANKFSKSDLYSPNEKMIGQWTDGKPLYQKTIEITDFSAITTGARNWYVLYNSQDTIYDQVFIKQDATFMSWDGDGQKWRAEPNEYLLDSLTPPSYSVIRPWVDSTGVLHISILNSGTSTPYKGSYNNKKLYVTIQYTKTTDSAISIGNDTDYSTTEKIVGTWIDGKPIYQKTVFFGGLPNNTTKQVNLPSCRAYCGKTDITVISTADVSSYPNAYATIQYTKTTD